MAESPLYDHPPAPPVLCDRCGRMFEAPIELDGKVIGGHIKGDPVLCVPLPSVAEAQERDARRRRAKRRGRA